MYNYNSNPTNIFNGLSVCWDLLPLKRSVACVAYAELSSPVKCGSGLHAIGLHENKVMLPKC